ncbi:unnamed protein product [Echinostoma caproni]|uniref:RING-type E3 ubiquitin transferase n=1 Tax=Echinostoma caproni TaxID=27848 RepID=A0A183AQI7_9TREM|nr:unnamed protein product [Echinostoma caproni]
MVSLSCPATPVAGVTCDACSQRDFRLRRYKCLVCCDYDLCGTCFDNQCETNQHLRTHPMQCLIPKADHKLFYNGEVSFCFPVRFSEYFLWRIS